MLLETREMIQNRPFYRLYFKVLKYKKILRNAQKISFKNKS